MAFILNPSVNRLTVVPSTHPPTAMPFSGSVYLHMLCLSFWITISLASDSIVKGNASSAGLTLGLRAEPAATSFALSRGLSSDLVEVGVDPASTTVLVPGTSRKRKRAADIKGDKRKKCLFRKDLVPSSPLASPENPRKPSPSQACPLSRGPATHCRLVLDVFAGLRLLPEALDKIVAGYAVDKKFLPTPRLILEFKHDLRCIFDGNQLVFGGLDCCTGVPRAIEFHDPRDVKTGWLLSQISRGERLKGFEVYDGMHIFVEDKGDIVWRRSDGGEASRLSGQFESHSCISMASSMSTNGLVWIHDNSRGGADQSRARGGEAPDNGRALEGLYP